jgi:ribonuclease HII
MLYGKALRNVYRNMEQKISQLLPFYKENAIEAGCDEAGRGCLSGPVFAAAVILPTNFYNPILNDSKKLSERKRNELRIIIENEALAFAVASVNNDEIDKINILNASILAMHKALNNLKIEPSHIIVDGNKFKPYKKTKHVCIVKGDGKYASIAAASILAKTYRDEYMLKMHDKFPQYHWNVNKGYATLLHRQAIEKYGLCQHHRLTFLKNFNQLKLNF